MWDNVSRHFILLVCHIQISKTMRPGKCIIEEEEVKSWGPPEKGIIKVFFFRVGRLKKKGSIYVNEQGAGKSHADCAGSHCEGRMQSICGIMC